MTASSRHSDSKQGISFRRIQNNEWKVENKKFTWSPPTDVYQTQGNYIIKVEISGMKNSEITINIEDNLLTVSGCRKEDLQQRSFKQIEIRSGDFNTSIELPDGLALDDSIAEYEDGFLIISIPPKKPMKIEIRG